MNSQIRNKMSFTLKFMHNVFLGLSFRSEKLCNIDEIEKNTSQNKKENQNLFMINNLEQNKFNQVNTQFFLQLRNRR